MNLCFADTAYFLAPLYPKDVHHGEARRLSETLRPKLLTTPWVLCEVGNAMSRVANRPVFVKFMRNLHSSTDITVTAPNRDSFDAGFRLYAQREDKAWSLTDCISFTVMDSFRVTDVLTSDRHFAQAGYKVLMPLS